MPIGLLIFSGLALGRYRRRIVLSAGHSEAMSGRRLEESPRQSARRAHRYGRVFWQGGHVAGCNRRGLPVNTGLLVHSSGKETHSSIRLAERVRERTVETVRLHFPLVADIRPSIARRVPRVLNDRLQDFAQLLRQYSLF